MNLAFMYIADGATFAPEMERLTELMKIRDDIYLYLLESFEWLLKMSEEEDRMVNLRNVMDFGQEEFVIYVINTN